MRARSMEILRVASVLILGAVVLAGGRSVGAAVEPQTIEMTVYGGDDVTDLTGYGNCQWLYPLDEPNETLAGEPTYASGKPVYYRPCYGDASDNVYTLVIDESGGTGTGYDTVYADRNNDNRIDPETEKLAFVLGTTRHAEPVRIELTVSAGGKTIPYSFEFSAFPYKDDNHRVEKIHANCRNSSIVVGHAEFGGAKRRIAIADLNSNGRFNDTEQGVFRGDRVFIDFDGDGKFRGESEAQERFPYGRYTNVRGQWYTIVASAAGTRVDIAPAQPSLVKVKGPPGVSRVTLHSETQSQDVTFADGVAEAIAGTYRLAGMELSARDTQGKVWTCPGSFRDAAKEVTIEASTQTRLPEVLPLTVSIEAASKAPFDVIALTPKLASAGGGTFRFPQRDGRRPTGAFQIFDAAGEVISTGKFEYG